MPLTGKIAIYGGSFNPPHMGHATVCMWLRKALNAAEVILVPTFEHPDKSGLEKFNHRISMCEYMVRGISHVSVSDIEKHLPTPSRTINTLEHYACCNLAVVIGSDLANGVRSWERWDEIEKLAQIVVIGRTDSEKNISSNWLYYPINLIGTSSSIVRERIRTGLDITGFVPKKVVQYIQLHNLYR